MADSDKVTDKKSTPDKRDQGQKDNQQLIIFLVVLAMAVIWGIQHPSTALRILGVMVGFGGIVMIHEFGHFIVAKMGGIKVEAFSIGMPPVALGFRKLKKGWRVRILPKMDQPENLQEGDHETEYQIGLLPIGGFVKMLGQSDTGAADADDNPRSYANRPIWIRICVVSAGVIFNAVGAAILFMALYMNGIDLPAGVVGDVVKNSPAYDVGSRPGDEIVEVNGESFMIDGKRCVDFETVFQAPLLSASGETIQFVVNREGVEETFSLIAEKKDGDPRGLRFSGLSPASRLEVSRYIKPEGAGQLYEEFDLCRGDKVKSVNGVAVQTPWEYKNILSETFQPEVELGVSRLTSQIQAAESGDWSAKIDAENGDRTMTTISFPMDIRPTVENFRNQYDMTHFGSLVPRLKVAAIGSPSRMEKIINWVRTKILQKEKMSSLADILQEGDILLKVGEIDYPNYKQLRELTTESKDQKLAITLLRSNEQGEMETIEVSVTPKARPGSKRVTVGFIPALDLDNPVVAQVLPVEGLVGDVHKIPAGAMITAINEQPVETYFDIAAAMQANAGKEIQIAYRVGDDTEQVSLTVPEHEPVHAEAYVLYALPFDELTQNYKASNPLEAAGMGFKKVGQFVVRNYITLGRLFQKDVPMSALSGPVGIISMTYQVTGASLDRTLYFLGLISSCLAVMNLLPLPVLDGGHIVLLVIEKITGKPVHEKILAPVMYIGLALLLTLILFITYRDVIKILFAS